MRRIRVDGLARLGACDRLNYRPLGSVASVGRPAWPRQKCQHGSSPWLISVAWREERVCTSIVCRRLARRAASDGSCCALPQPLKKGEGQRWYVCVHWVFDGRRRLPSFLSSRCACRCWSSRTPCAARELLETKHSGERRHCKWCLKYKPERKPVSCRWHRYLRIVQRQTAGCLIPAVW